jgi:hypothetical protein
MLWALFAATGFLFWVWFAVLCVAVIASLENDSLGWAFASTLIGLFLLLFLTDFVNRYQVWEYLTLKNFVGVGLCYALCGVAYSFMKWYLFLSARLERWKEVVRSFRDKFHVSPEQKVTPGTPQMKDFVKLHYPEFWVLDHGDYRVLVKPRPLKNRIVGWMVYWPWSLLWSLFDDVITGFFKYLYRHLVGSYDAMANYMFRGVE